MLKKVRNIKKSAAFSLQHLFCQPNFFASDIHNVCMYVVWTVESNT